RLGRRVRVRARGRKHDAAAAAMRMLWRGIMMRPCVMASTMRFDFIPRRGVDGHSFLASAASTIAVGGPLRYCNRDVGFDRVGNETILVCSVMHLIEFVLGGSSVAAPHNLGT